MRGRKCNPAVGGEFEREKERERERKRERDHTRWTFNVYAQG
jgi:hypothetical protein